MSTSWQMLCLCSPSSWTWQTPTLFAHPREQLTNMPLHLLPSLLLHILMVGYTPGPANLYALSCSLKYGRKSALRMWYGELCGFLISVTLVSIATHFIGTTMGEYVGWLKYVGATYILWLAYNIYKTKGLAESEAKTCTFMSGMLVQLTNAKMILFDLTIFSMFVLPYSNRLIDLLIVGSYWRLQVQRQTLYGCLLEHGWGNGL